MRKSILKILSIVVILILVIILIAVFESKKPPAGTSAWLSRTGRPVDDMRFYTAPKPAVGVVEHNGHIWFGTHGGILEVEPTGKIVHLWTMADGLASHKVLAIASHSGGVIVGTDVGLSIISGQGIVNYFPPETSEVSAIAVSGDEIALAGGFGSAIFKNSKFIRLKPNFSDIRKICPTPFGFVFIRQGSVMRVSKDTLLEITKFKSPITGTAIHSKRVSPVPISAVYHGDNLFISALRVGFRVELDGRTTSIPSLCEISAMKSEKNDLWAASWNKIGKIEEGNIRWKVVNGTGYISDFVRAFGKIWIAGDEGPFVLDEEDISDISSRTNPIPLAGEGFLGENKISAVAVFDNKLWAGTFSSGLYVFENNRWIRAYENISPFVNFLLPTPYNLWVATDRGAYAISRDGGLTKFDRRSGLISDNVESFSWDGARIWLAGKGLCRQESFGWRQYYVSDGLCGANTYQVAFDEGNVWVACYGGVSVFGDFKRCFTRGDGALAHDWATAIVSSDYGVFVGTYGGGIARFFGGRWTRVVDGSAGAVINTHSATLWRGNPVFGSADRGALIWDTDHFYTIGRREGLPADGVMSVYSDGQTLWLGTENGLVEIKEGR